MREKRRRTAEKSGELWRCILSVSGIPFVDGKSRNGDAGPGAATESEVVNHPDVGFLVRIHNGEVASVRRRNTPRVGRLRPMPDRLRLPAERNMQQACAVRGGR